MHSHAGGIVNGSLGQGAEDELALRHVWVPLSAKSQGGGTPARLYIAMMTEIEDQGQHLRMLKSLPV